MRNLSTYLKRTLVVILTASLIITPLYVVPYATENTDNQAISAISENQTGGGSDRV